MKPEPPQGPPWGLSHCPVIKTQHGIHLSLVPGNISTHSIRNKEAEDTERVEGGEIISTVVVQIGKEISEKKKSDIST